ncbi:SMI1/KNR4 family protein [Streptomyces asoensis]|uniref:SMI1/KNR4 family protein n=1 Tax=Streptomyces asoensis TaxID=249586 RepID=UPI003330930C
MSAPFPARLRGADRAGFDMVMIDSDTAGCVSTWIANDGSLDARGHSVLVHCVARLEQILPTLGDADDPPYWQRLHELARLVADPRSRPTDRAALAGLLRLIPPSAGAGVTVDWEAVERAWGLVFPPDFKEFLAHYGGGLSDLDLGVLVPATVTPETCDEPGAPKGGMGFITADTRATWVDTEPTGVDAAAEDLVTWGADGSADLYCWLTHGDPEDWPVVLFSHGVDTWTLFDCGMAEFLRRVLSADGRAEAMQESALWGAGLREL